jgi:DNA replication protein DnaC
MTASTDIAVLPTLLTALRLPSIARNWKRLTDTADREGWPAAKLLATLFEIEVADRTTRRIQRHLAESDLPTGKTFAVFDFTAAEGIKKAQILGLADGPEWLDAGTNLLLFGRSGAGKSHLLAALGHAFVEAGRRVLFTRTTDMVQKLQVARRELALASALDKLDKYDLLCLDDLTYVRKDQAETSVLFELIAHRYERRSIAITANQPFSAFDQVFPDPAMTAAAIDRLIHHATIIEFRGPSYRQRAAEGRIGKKEGDADN